ncbi:MAG: SCO family protein [Alphaproteobacteria bacterium]|nr:SCO family protein [Alphaproteobacteria bacterium]
MNASLKNRLKRTALLALIGLGIGALIAAIQILQETKQGTPSTVAGIAIGGPFNLTDQAGKTVTEKDFAGKTLLMYFGFTSCPAICPTELSKIVAVLKALGPDGDGITPVFVTVDPARDTVDVIKSYVAQFHPRLIGLTGTQEQIDVILKNYRIYAARVDTPEMSDYTMDHSSFIYFIGPDGALRGIYRAQDDAQIIAHDVEKFLKKLR